MDAEHEKPTTYKEPGKELITQPGRFRLNNRYALLTYKTHILKDAYTDWMMEKIPTTTWIRLAHETGNEYPHTHVLLDLGKAFQTRNCRFFDYGEGENAIHPNIKVLANKHAFEDAQHYIAKEDPANADIKKKPDWKEGVLNARTPLEAAKLAGKPSDITGILQLHSLKKRDFRRRAPEQIELRQWQEDLLNELAEPPDKSTIIWLANPGGGAGKNTFAEWVCDQAPDEYLLTTDLGTSRDAATILYNSLNMGWTGHCIFMNLTRNCEHHDRMYDYIEAIKDGRLTLQKYSGFTVRFDNPHVVIMANWLPKVEKLSLYKWDIRKLIMYEGVWISIKLKAADILEKQKRDFSRKTGTTFGGMAKGCATTAHHGFQGEEEE